VKDVLTRQKALRYFNARSTSRVVAQAEFYNEIRRSCRWPGMGKGRVLVYRMPDETLTRSLQVAEAAWRDEVVYVSK
jgi:hypothetical protein